MMGPLSPSWEDKCFNASLLIRSDYKEVKEHIIYIGEAARIEKMDVFVHEQHDSDSHLHNDDE